MSREGTLIAESFSMILTYICKSCNQTLAVQFMAFKLFNVMRKLNINSNQTMLCHHQRDKEDRNYKRYRPIVEA